MDAGNPFSGTMRQSGAPPWHMWGVTKTFVMQTGGLGAFEEQTVQLSRVTYRRPDTWQWVFAVQVVKCLPEPVVGVQVAGIAIDFDVNFGLGLSSFNVPRFERFEWTWAFPSRRPTFPQISTRVYGGARLQTAPPYGTPDLNNPIDQLTFENLVCQARVNSSSNYVTEITVEIASYFAPRSHMRPDWMQIDAPPEAQFPGAEVGGR